VNPVNLAVTTLVWIYFFPREAAGASSTRHSPRPLNVQKALQDAKLARGVRRDRGGVCVSSRGKKGKPCVWKCTGRVAYSATASPVLSLPLLWGGWREAPGGANSRITKQPPPVTSFAPLTMCHPRASFARLDPTKVGGIRKSELRWTRGRRVAARRPHPSRRRFAPLWMRLIRRACGLILMVRSAATPRVSNHEAGIETEEETM